MSTAYQIVKERTDHYSAGARSSQVFCNAFHPHLKEDGQWCLKRAGKKINLFRTVCAAEVAFDRLEREDEVTFSRLRRSACH